MKKTLQIIMEVEISDLSREERKENAELIGCKPGDLVGLADVTAYDVADSLVGAMAFNEENFAGSDMHIKMLDTRLIEGTWLVKA
jgi:hypothetical protein